MILSFDGKRVDRMRRLPRIVAESRIGKETTVEVWRKGKEMSLPLTVGELKETEAAATAAVSEEKPRTEKQAIPGLGLSLSVITPALRSQYTLDEEVEGLVVTAVDDGGAADEKGVQEGDVLVEVNQDAVEEPAQVIEKVEASRKDGRRSVLLLVDRKGDLRFIAVGIAKD